MRSALPRQILRARSGRLQPGARRLLSELPLAQTELPPQPFPLYSPTPDEFYNRAPRPDVAPQPPKGPLSPEEQATRDKAAAESSLQAARRLKREMTAQYIDAAPELTEAELRAFYQDLVKSGQDELQLQEQRLALEAPDEEAEASVLLGSSKGKSPAILPPISNRRRGEILSALIERLDLDLEPPSSSLGQLSAPPTNGERSSAVSAASLTRHTARPLQDPGLRQQLLRQLLTLVPDPSSGATGPRGPNVPLGLLTRKEWHAVLDEMLSWNDIGAAVSLLQIMPTHGVQPEPQMVYRIMETAASRESPANLVKIMSGLLGGGSIPFRAHRLVIPVLLARDPQLGLDYLEVFENQADPAPQAVYQHVLQGLLVGFKGQRRHVTSRMVALGFDLFAHMRLVAHPQPSKEVYATMIEGCAHPDNPQPERARDLWTEMTTEGRQYIPTRVEYDALIAALSSAKDTYLDAFEVYRTMIARHEDATRVPFEDESVDRRSPYMPTLSTWKALMSGAKRAGDLERGRWLLGQMMRSLELAADQKELDEVMPDAQSMISLFHTYAAWTAPKPTAKVRFAKSKPSSSSSHATGVESVKNAQLAAPASGSEADNRYGPRTSAEALAEATAIFERILAESFSTFTPTPAAPRSMGPFSRCQLTTALINAYLSVVLAHSPSLQAAKEGWDETWRKVDGLVKGWFRNSQKNGWSYLQVLEKCAAGRRGGVKPADRELSVEWGRTIWAEYMAFSAQAQTSLTALTKAGRSERVPLSSGDMRRRLGLDPRVVERCWTAAIRLHAKNLLVSAALKLMADFSARFPPSDISDQYAPWLPNRSLVPATDPTLIAESDVPPHILFKDVDVLHQELAQSEMFKELAWVKYTLKAYEGALKEMRTRRLQDLNASRPAAKHGMLGDFVLPDVERRKPAGEISDRRASGMPDSLLLESIEVPQ